MTCIILFQEAINFIANFNQIKKNGEINLRASAERVRWSQSFFGNNWQPSSVDSLQPV